MRFDQNRKTTDVAFEIYQNEETFVFTIHETKLIIDMTVNVLINFG